MANHVERFEELARAIQYGNAVRAMALLRDLVSAWDNLSADQQQLLQYFRDALQGIEQPSYVSGHEPTEQSGSSGDDRWWFVLDAIVKLHRDGIQSKAASAIEVVLEYGTKLSPEQRQAFVAFKHVMALVPPAQQSS